MRRTVALALTIVTVTAVNAFGHGNPIDVDVADERLTVGGGLPLSEGYAQFAFDPHEDAFLDFGPGQKLRTTYPGLNIAGLAGEAALNLEVISRPDFTSAANPNRWLWYWNSATQLVEPVPNNPRFDASPLFGSGTIGVRQDAVLAGPTLTVADPVEPFLGQDQHLLLFELSNSPAAAIGVYAVFARLTSPGLDPSEPFLLAFKYGVGVEGFADAVEAINSAAGLAGDYDVDGDVDGNDFLIWQRTLGTTGPSLAGDGSLDGEVDAVDLAIWKEEFGRVVESPSVATTISIPEPDGAVVIASLCAALALATRRLGAAFPMG